MSYCRFSNADLYVFPSDRGFECCGCPDGKAEDGKLIVGRGFFVTQDAPAMIMHMLNHAKNGLDVPEYAYWGVWDDRHLYHYGPCNV